MEPTLIDETTLARRTTSAPRNERVARAVTNTVECGVVTLLKGCIVQRRQFRHSNLLARLPFRECGVFVSDAGSRDLDEASEMVLVPSAIASS